MSAKADPKWIDEVSRLITASTGVQLGHQAHMVEGRIKSRLIRLGLADFAAYQEYFAANREAELKALLSTLTTHHTYFFREFRQVDYLRDHLLEMVVRGVRERKDNTLRIWSAAASRGQEAYSLAMYFHLHLKEIAPDLQFAIHGTDVDHESISIAKNGVYPYKDVNVVPLMYQAGHWARGTGEIAAFVKAKDSLRRYVSFSEHNILEPYRRQSNHPFDLVFCRNLFIYFNPDQIARAVQLINAQMAPNGLLLLGLSESLTGVNQPMESDKYSIYKAAPAAIAHASVRSQSAKPIPKPVVVSTRPLRVLCVDDSKSVLAILSKVFGAQDSGFELVGTAMNGIEAAKKVAELKPDVMTLDIHMPEMDGLTYLQKHFGPNHPAVVMVTSVSREQQDLALSCLKAGASDYVEKPTLSNFAETSEEIKSKLQTAHKMRAGTTSKGDLLELDREMAERVMPASGTNLRAGAQIYCIMSEADLEKVANLASEMPKDFGVRCLVHGAASKLPELSEKLATVTKRRFEVLQPGSSATLNGTVSSVGDLRQSLQEMKKSPPTRSDVVAVVFGTNLTPNFTELLQVFSTQLQLQCLLFEDSYTNKSLVKTYEKTLSSMPIDVVPATSFGYMALDALRRRRGVA